MEDFYRKYTRPRMDRVTVGFSGIDPAPRGSILNPDTPEDAQAAQGFVDGCIASYFNNGSINLDSGEITAP